MSRRDTLTPLLCDCTREARLRLITTLVMIVLVVAAFYLGVRLEHRQVVRNAERARVCQSQLRTLKAGADSLAHTVRSGVREMKGGKD